MSRSDVLRSILPALLIAAACRPADPRGSFVVDTLPGGIVRAHSTGPVAWADTNGWRLVREQVIRPTEGSDTAFGRSGVIVADEGTGEIYVLDRGPAVIKRFDRDGHFLGFIGHQGAGPGEFRDHGNLYLVDSFLVHHDHGLARFSVFTRDGRLLRAFPSISRIGMALRTDDLGRIPVVIMVPQADGTSREALARYRIDGTIADTVWSPALPSGGWWMVDRNGVSAAHEIPFAPVSASVLDRHGDWISGEGAAGRLIVGRTGTDTIRIIEAAFASVPLPDGLQQRLLDSLTAKHQWLMGTAKVGDIPAALPLWDELEPDARGNLWVRRQVALGEWRWSVIDPNGQWLGDVPTPFGDVTSSYWGKDRVYILTTDADGYPQVEVWRIDR